MPRTGWNTFLSNNPKVAARNWLPINCWGLFSTLCSLAVVLVCCHNKKLDQLDVFPSECGKCSLPSWLTKRGACPSYKKNSASVLTTVSAPGLSKGFSVVLDSWSKSETLGHDTALVSYFCVSSYLLLNVSAAFVLLNCASFFWDPARKCLSLGV